MNIFTFFCLSFLTLNGVFGDPDEVKSVSVMDGDSVTLHTDVVKQKDDVILWCYGPENMLVAKTNGKVGSEKYYDGTFRDRVKLDDQTGSLTITNMRTEDSGLYTLKISKKKISYKRFNVTVYGVGFGDAGEVKSVSVMEGDSVTLHTDLTHIQRHETIIWLYGPENTLVAKIHGKVSDTEYYGGDVRFRDRVNLNDQTGSLTITNIKSHHSGLYTLKISKNNSILHKKYSVTVHARLPVPVIYSSQRSSSERSSCMLLCSVMNVSHDVSVSWYKGKSLLSSISVSDLNIRLSLPLEVEYQDTNTYRCVVNNPITNLEQHLHINQLCHMSSDSPGMRVITIGVVFTLLLCVNLIIVGVYLHKRAHLINTLHSKVPLTDEEGSITSENTEASGFLHEQGTVKVPL